MCLHGPRPGGRTVRRGGSKHRCPEAENESGWSATLGDRIRLFVAGEWAELWRETLRVSYVLQESRASFESAEKRRVQRVNALWEEGELARAAAAALGRHSWCSPETLMRIEISNLLSRNLN